MPLEPQAPRALAKIQSQGINQAIPLLRSRRLMAIYHANVKT
ncbi:hypothetical protein XVE_4708, partial [Xanthomonas vesicatoria ATCC 35937]